MDNQYYKVYNKVNHIFERLLRMIRTVMGIPYNSINDLARKLNVSASGINKYIKKNGDITKGVEEYMYKEGGSIKFQGVNYPTTLVALYNLYITPKIYKTYINYEKCTPAQALGYLSSPAYKKIGLPIEFEGTYHSSVLDLCKHFDQNYEKISMYSLKYEISFRNALKIKLEENEPDKDDIYNIFGINYPTKSKVYLSCKVSPKTILDHMQKTGLDFEKAVESYLQENRVYEDKEKYYVNGKYVDTQVKVFNELGVSKKEFYIMLEKKELSFSDTIRLYEARNINNNKFETLVFLNKSYSNYKALCKDKRIPYMFVINRAKEFNVPLKEVIMEFMELRKAHRIFNGLTDYQKKFILTLSAKKMYVEIINPSQEHKIVLRVPNSDIMYNPNKIGIHSLSYPTIKALKSLDMLILRKQENSNNLQLFLNKNILQKVKKYSTLLPKINIAIQNEKRMEKL